MNKNVLVITPFFPPQTHAAVFRAFKLVKYLKRAGWNPIVLTVNRNYQYLEDPKLLNEIEGVPVYRANYVEPTVRGLKMLLGGKDTSLKNMVTSSTKSYLSSTSTQAYPSLFKRLYCYLLNRWIQVPDRFVFWKHSAVKLGCKIIKNHNVSIIYTTCLPFTSNSIGLKLKQKTGVKWVADFRDPITYAKRMYSDNPHIFIKQKKIEQKTLKYADAITGLSGAYVSIFDDLYKGEYTYKTSFIPTGVDDDYLPNLAENGETKGNYIIFVGEYLAEYKDYFLKIFAEAVHSNELKGEKCILKIIGNKAINQKQLSTYIERLQLQQNVELIDHIPQRELYKLISKAKAAVLIPGYTSLWWTNFAKLVDYIALQVPVLAIVPMTSEARTELTKAQTGLFIDNYEQGVKLIKDVFKNEISINPNKEYCKRYLASQQTNSFIELFQNL